MNHDEDARPDPVRPRRQFEVERDSWLAIDAWRSPGEIGLCYFVPLEEGAPTEDDRTDRRAPLEPAQHLEELDEEALAALWSTGAPLTVTERRITDAEGELWLVRSTGPSWAGAGAAAGTTGTLFRCLTRVGRDIETRAAGPVLDQELADLRQVLERTEGSS
jgi:hypothetical protein